jgi:hypothetical protein
MPVSPAQRRRNEIASEFAVRNNTVPVHVYHPTQDEVGAAPMTQPEWGRLAQLEAVIGRGLKSFIEVGLAMKEIRDSKLYRQQHRTFGDYCRKRWGLSRIHAHRLIQAAGVSTDLLPIGNNHLLTCEAQARELVRLSPEKRRKVWATVTAPKRFGAGRHAPTAEQIREAVHEEHRRELANPELTPEQVFAQLDAEGWAETEAWAERAGMQVQPQRMASFAHQLVKMWANQVEAERIKYILRGTVVVTFDPDIVTPTTDEKEVEDLLHPGLVHWVLKNGRGKTLGRAEMKTVETLERLPREGGRP